MRSSHVSERKGRQAWPAHWSPSPGCMRIEWLSAWKASLAHRQQPRTVLLRASKCLGTCAGVASLVCLALWFAWTWWCLPAPQHPRRGTSPCAQAAFGVHAVCVSHDSPWPQLRGQSSQALAGHGPTNGCGVRSLAWTGWTNQKMS